MVIYSEDTAISYIVIDFNDTVTIIDFNDTTASNTVLSRTVNLTF